MYLRYDQFIGISIRSPVTETALNRKPSFQRTGMVNVSTDEGVFSPLQMRTNLPVSSFTSYVTTLVQFLIVMVSPL